MTLPPLRFLLPIFVLSLAALGLPGCAVKPMAPGAFSTVVIDAGHGGKDNGAHSRAGTLEKTLTLDTARRLQPMLEDEGLHTVMTRTQDVFVELSDRVAVADAQPKAILVSIHYNASPNSTPRGIETFFWRPDSFGYATRVQRELVAATGLENRGVTRRVLRLTRSPTVPCILCECGFLSNSQEASVIATPEFHDKIARGIAEGILEQRELGDTAIGLSMPPIERTVRPVPHHHASRRHRHTSATHHQTATHKHHHPAKAAKSDN